VAFEYGYLLRFPALEIILDRITLDSRRSGYSLPKSRYQLVDRKGIYYVLARAAELAYEEPLILGSVD